MWKYLLVLLCGFQLCTLSSSFLFPLARPPLSPSARSIVHLPSSALLAASLSDVKSINSNSNNHNLKKKDSKEMESKRLQKARLRIAEAQGIIPIGASEDSNFNMKEYMSSLSSSNGQNSVSKVREISWKVAEPAIPYDPKAAAVRLWRQPFKWLIRNIQIFVPLTLFAVTVITDVLLEREKANRQMRADQLTDIISSQSPALIKAGN